MTSLGIAYHRIYDRDTLEVAKLTLVKQAQEQLDACGLKCPEPLMLVRNKVRSMRSGEVLLVRATDPTTERDLNHFCQFLGHEMLDTQTRSWRFRVFGFEKPQNECRANHSSI